jgi:hypothetical protein
MTRPKKSQSDSIEPEGTQQSPVLTIAETALLFRTSVKSIRKAARSGELEVIKLGRTTYVLREPLEQKLKAKVPLVAATPSTRAAKSAKEPPA